MSAILKTIFRPAITRGKNSMQLMDSSIDAKPAKNVVLLLS